MSTYNLTDSNSPIDTPTSRTIFVFGGIALYNTLELTLLILLKFRRRRGLYFYSLLITTLCIIPLVIGLLLRMFYVVPVPIIPTVILVPGWNGMVIGQSLVLYSRLHLLAPGRMVLRAVLGVIAANACFSNVPISVFVILSTLGVDKTEYMYGIWERIQICMYFAQEVFISGLYIQGVAKMMHFSFTSPFTRSTRKKSTVSTTGGSLASPGPMSKAFESLQGRKVMKYLLYVNIIIILLDISILACEFTGNFNVQAVYKPAVYSVKLKLEFHILNHLTAIASRNLRSGNSYFQSSRNSPITSPPISPGATRTRRRSSRGEAIHLTRFDMQSISEVTQVGPPPMLSLRRHVSEGAVKTLAQVRNEAGQEGSDRKRASQPVVMADLLWLQTMAAMGGHTAGSSNNSSRQVSRTTPSSPIGEPPSILHQCV